MSVKDKLVVNALLGVFLVFLVGAVAIYSGHLSQKTSSAMSQVDADRYDLSIQTKDIVIDFKKQVQAWKDILLRGRNPDKFIKYKEEFLAQNGKVTQELGQLHEKMTTLGLDTKPVDDATEAYEKLKPIYLEALETYDPSVVNSYVTVDGLVTGIDRPATKQINDLSERLGQILEQRAKTIRENGQAMERKLGVWTIALFIASAVILLLTLAISLHALRDLTSQIHGASAKLISASEGTTLLVQDITSSCATLAEGSSRQAAALEEI